VSWIDNCSQSQKEGPRTQHKEPLFRILYTDSLFLQQAVRFVCGSVMPTVAFQFNTTKKTKEKDSQKIMSRCSRDFPCNQEVRSFSHALKSQ